jgi:hypothetical protein
LSPRAGSTPPFSTTSATAPLGKGEVMDLELTENIAAVTGGLIKTT